MKQDRFRIVHHTSEHISSLLVLLDFRKLEKQATDKNSINKSIFIDIKRREFWIVDKESLQQSVEFVNDYYRQKAIEIKLQE
ncbi:hypothetical protein [Aquimarina longa]|uniref:hypothetical protein n=1 Tax=Aquimarina longa TaxID=1080221 RepID=UPI000785E481|nr:hypothetical protein [Aquimarina longa]